MESNFFSEILFTSKPGSDMIEHNILCLKDKKILYSVV